MSEMRFNNELKALNAIYELLLKCVPATPQEIMQDTLQVPPKEVKGSEPTYGDDMLFGCGYITKGGIEQFLKAETDGWLIEYLDDIWDSCEKYQIEPIHLLAKIQHEQSALYKKPSVARQNKLLGYGVMETGRHKNFEKKYKGVKNQIENCCRGFRGYLSGNHRKVVDKWISGRTVDYGDWRNKTFYAGSIAEGCLMRYTPRVEEIEVLSNIWRDIFDKCVGYELVGTKNPSGWRDL